METQAIKNVFNNHAKNVFNSSTKSMTGHTLGADGAIEFIAGAFALKHKLIPPTINYENPDPECDLNYVPNQARDLEINHAISNSLGFGGHNASILISKFIK